MMNLVSFLFAVLLPGGSAFQFMSKWKMPTYDPFEEAVKEKFGDKKLAVITGCSSGLGRKTALALLGTGEYHVIGAVRDLDKMEAVAEVDGFDMDNFTPMYCELNSFNSVREFCNEVDKFRMSKPIDNLICNAGVYQPSLPYPKWSLDNHEQTMQINFLSHFLMVSKLMDSMMDSADPRVVMVGSVTGNDNTVGGGGVYPIADLHDLAGFKKGFENPISMADGYSFLGAKSYKDSKLCLMMMANFLHTKYHKLTGISFSSMYPGCIAESPLFREKRAWFRKYFPVFMKFITGGFVGEHEAGQRLMQVAHDPRCSKSGVYWSWNGGPREGRGKAALEKGGQISGGGGAGGGWDSLYENDQSAKVLDVATQMDLFKYATEITKAEWPDLRQIVSPCPTLKVIGAVTKGMTQREELKRVRESSRADMGETSEPVAKPSKKQRVVLATDRVVTGVLSNTVGRVARFFGKRLLGEFPDEAINGSYHNDRQEDSETKGVHMEDLDAGQELLEQEVSGKLAARESAATIVDEEDEALFQEIFDAESSSASEPSSQERRSVSA